jgi:oligopeptide transport system substrate-binding protein
MKMNGRFYMTKSLLNSVAILAISVAVLSSCSGEKKTSASEKTKSQILHIGNGSEPQGLDPQVVTGIPEFQIITALLEGLVTEDPETIEPMPGAAESWTISEDHKTYVFKMREGAKWSNGDPVTAHDFVYSWKRLITPGLASQYAYQLFYLKNAKKYYKGEITDFNEVGVRAVDDKTLEVKLNNPVTFFLSLLYHHSLYPVHRGTIEKFGNIDSRVSKWTLPGNFVGNGPFVLKKWGINQEIVVEKNPLYWDASNVKLDEIHFYSIDNELTEERMFRSGQLHLTNTVPSGKIEVYKEKSPELISIHPYMGTYYYMINTLKEPFTDPRVRKAFAMSIDRRQIVEKVTKGGQIPAYAFTPPGTMGFTPEAAIPYDIAVAKKLLAEAGYPDGKGFPECELIYNTSEGHQKIAVAVQQMWKQTLNVNVSLANQDWKVFLDNQRTKNFLLSRAAWIGDYPDPNTFLDMWVTGGGNNHTGWSNKTYDDLIAKAAHAIDKEERYGYFQQAEKILADEVPIIPVYTYTRVFLIRPEVKGWYPNILDHHPYQHVYLEEKN